MTRLTTAHPRPRRTRTHFGILASRRPRRLGTPSCLLRLRALSGGVERSPVGLETSRLGGERADAPRDRIVISELGLFIQHGPAARGPELSARGPLVPWAYRSVVEWWPDLVSSEPEARELERCILSSGEPALEVGFGMGRRLAACRAAGVDIDGLEPSRGLYAACRTQLEQHGLSAHRLYTQPLHELELPRRYRTIYVARALGSLASPEADASALARLYRALEPGGTLLVEQPAPWGSGRFSAAPQHPPSPWPPPLPARELRSACGREVLELSGELYEHAPETRSLTYVVHARHLRDGKLVARRGFGLRQRFYSTRDVFGLLCRAGFDEPRVACVARPEVDRRVWAAEKVQRWRGVRASSLGGLGGARSGACS